MSVTAISTTASSMLRKLLVTVVAGILAYFLADLTKQSRAWVWALTIFVAGVLLVIQFLIDFERRLTAVERAEISHTQDIRTLVEEGFSKINEATELFGLVEASALRTDVVTQLVRNSTELEPSTPPLVYRFAQSEIGRMSQFLKELKDGDASYDGEDRDWLLGLARNAKMSIDATSLTTVDAGGRGFDGGFWETDLGQRYLETQREVAQRQVKIRRVFILDRLELASDSNFLQMLRLQANMNIEVRILDAAAIPAVRKSSLFDFILFDSVISYEVTPASRVDEAMRPTILNTRLVLRPDRVEDRIDRFRDLWASARPFAPDKSE
jgi:hypothetical protein